MYQNIMGTFTAFDEGKVAFDRAPGSGTGAFQGLVSKYQSERDGENGDEEIEESAARTHSLDYCPTAIMG